MLTRLNLPEQEIQRLNYERYHYPCPVVQKRLHAVYLKAALSYSNEFIATIVDSHRNMVSAWIKAYQSEGFDALCQVGYGTNQSNLEQKAQSILESFSARQ
jgi:transposase